MPIEFSGAQHQALRAAISSIRHSLERAIGVDPSADPTLSAALLCVEAIRIAFLGARPRTNPTTFSSAAVEQSLRSTRQALQDAISNKAFIKHATRMRFVAIRPPEGNVALNILFGRNVGRLSAYDATYILLSALNKTLGLSNDRNLSQSISDLKDIVPEQHIAPVKFEIYEGKLCLISVKSKSEAEDLKNIQIARDELIFAGKQIVDELRNSNCDPRLLKSLENLNNHIAENADIIRIGLSNLQCIAMCDAFSSELPSAVASMIRAQTRGVEMYAAQFPDWNRFSEQAATSALTQEDYAAISEANRQAIENLEKQNDLVDPQVPAILQYLQELAQKPGRSAKRLFYSVLRSVENLIGVILKHFAEFADDTTTRTRKGLSRTASVILVGIALHSATTLLPISVNVQELSWLQSAIEIVRREVTRSGQ